MNANARINKFVKTLLAEKITLALAESMTCGLAAHRLSTVKGTSEVLKGSVVCYNSEVKTDLFRISGQILKKHSAESAIVTDILAQRLKRFIKADVHAAITGLASAGGSETRTKPVGTVFFSVRWKNKTYRLRKVFSGTPLQVREQACLTLYDFILKLILK